MRFGLGDAHPDEDPVLAPLELGLGRAWTRVDLASAPYSGKYTCALTDAGSLWCSGHNDHGELGDGSGVNSAVFVQERSASAWSAVSVNSSPPGGASYAHACGIKLGGSLWCWGSGTGGKLGVGDLGDVTDRLEPTRVAPELPGPWVDVDAGPTVTCGIRGVDRSAWCWGYNSAGQVGDGSVERRMSPVAVVGAGRFIDIAVGGYFSCAIDEAQALWCWGSNYVGQLGDGTSTDRPSPVQVVGDARWRSVTASRRHVCAMRSDDRLFCWGDNRNGQLGVTPRDWRLPGPVTLPD